MSATPAPPLDLYMARSPVAFKVLIALEEMNLSYNPISVDVMTGEQLTSQYSAINPNQRVPALVDHAPTGGGAPLQVFESGAILVYLAEKSGRFFPTALRERMSVLQWVFWQMAGQGPAMGQARHFLYFARERCPYAIERFTYEAGRLCRILDRQLAGREYICDRYSIADMACWPWLLYAKSNQLDLESFVNLARWFRAIEDRDAVARVAERYWKGLPIEAAFPLDPAAQQILFGWKSGS
jgi:GSH-dependent disulfide-bond oxidoreductase